MAELRNDGADVYSVLVDPTDPTSLVSIEAGETGTVPDELAAAIAADRADLSVAKPRAAGRAKEGAA